MVVFLRSAFTVFEMALIHRELNSLPTSPELWTLNEKLTDLHFYLYTGFFWATTIPFACWIHRVASNTLFFEFRSLRHGPGMAVLCYFIPIVNLYRPYLDMRTINTVSSSHGHCSAKRLLPWWWAFWLITSISGSVMAVIWEKTESYEEFMRADALHQGVFFSDAAVTILALVLIRRITHAQLQRENPRLLPAGTAPAA